MDVNKIVSEIISRCEFENIEGVTEPLAAFVAKTIVEDDSDNFALSKHLDDNDVAKLIMKSVEFLSKKDHPPLETIKMQLNFDLSYISLEEEIEIAKLAKEKKMKNTQRAIISVQAPGSNDFEALTSLYRKIFTLLMINANSETNGDRNVEREIAAALESVFPRIGLKAFMSMSAEDKQFQLSELTGIVDGIRLFNREIGKGGAGITLTIQQIKNDVDSICDSVRGKLDEINEICTIYTEVLIFAHHTDNYEISEKQINRWQDELRNRRQLLSYLHSLQEDISFLSEKITGYIDTFENEMSSVESLVGSRTSIPKEQVYPVFEALSEAWKTLTNEHALLLCRSRCLESLIQFKHSIDCTLSPTSDWVIMAKKAKQTTQDNLFGENSVKFSTKSHAIVDDLDRSNEGLHEGNSNNTPIRLSIESTPEFMQLPLEYQGYCPWTICNRNALLLPGDPSIGVVEYKNTYNVFVNEKALSEFMNAPDEYLDRIKNEVMKNPELIYLLRMQDVFPETSLAKLINKATFHGPKSGIHPLLAPAAPLKVDASTETPLHFVEKNIDYDYEWNEWALRRRALKIANLRKCKTVSVQTTQSNFRKEIETQVYLQHPRSTQTGISRGTNPPRTVSYFAGIRNKAGNGKKCSKYITSKLESSTTSENDDGDSSRPAMVTYTYDV